MLLVTFTLMLSLKGAHYHYAHVHDDCSSAAQSNAQTTVKAACDVCDFVFQKAALIQNNVNVKPLDATFVKHLAFTPQLVYRRVLRVNTNSPPLF